MSMQGAGLLGMKSERHVHPKVIAYSVPMRGSHLRLEDTHLGCASGSHTLKNKWTTSVMGHCVSLLGYIISLILLKASIIISFEVKTVTLQSAGKLLLWFGYSLNLYSHTKRLVV